jgi:hydrogenase maturation protease
MGDDGIGIYVAEALRQEELPPHVGIFDGATRAFDVLEYMDGCEKAIIVDACKRNGTPGSIYRYCFNPGDDVQDRSLNLSVHDINFMDALKAGKDVYRLPSEIVVIGVEPQILECRLGLSSKLARAIPEIIKAVRSEIL